MKSQFDLPKSKQIYLQRFDNDWNEYIDVSQIEDVKHKDKLVIVVVDGENGANQDNTVKVAKFDFFSI